MKAPSNFLLNRRQRMQKKDHPAQGTQDGEKTKQKTKTQHYTCMCWTPLYVNKHKSHGTRDIKTHNKTIQNTKMMSNTDHTKKPGVNFHHGLHEIVYRLTMYIIDLSLTKPCTYRLKLLNGLRNVLFLSSILIFAHLLCKLPITTGLSYIILVLIEPQTYQYI